MFDKCSVKFIPNSSYCIFYINSFVDCDFINKDAKRITLVCLYPFRNFTIPDMVDLLQKINKQFPLSEVFKYQFIFSSDREVECDYIYRYA